MWALYGLFPLLLALYLLAGLFFHKRSFGMVSSLRKCEVQAFGGRAAFEEIGW